MANSLFSYINHVDASATVLTASDTASADVPASNLQTSVMGKRWRTTNLTAHMDVDFGSNKTVAAVATFFPRDTMGDLGGNIQHQFDADGGTPGTGATHDSGTISLGMVEGFGYHLYVPSASFSARHWRFTFSSISGVNFIDVGRAWAGDTWQPDPNISFGYLDGWDDLTQVARSQRSGAEYADERAILRFFDVSLRFMGESDRNTARELIRAAGRHDQVFFVRDPDDANVGREVIIGRLRETRPIEHPTFDIFSTSFRIRESG